MHHHFEPPPVLSAVCHCGGRYLQKKTIVSQKTTKKEETHMVTYLGLKTHWRFKPPILLAIGHYGGSHLW